jgi:nucleotide-binding universal stress UspA family protein
MSETINAYLNVNVDSPILVATDFSEDSKAALLWACAFAGCTGAPLILLHVVHDLASKPGFYHPDKTSFMEPMQDVAESMMEEFLTRVRSEHPELAILSTVAVQFVPGLPPSRIVEVSGLLKASLIAMGCCGMTSHSHKRLGAVAERVAEKSVIPVVLLKSLDPNMPGKKALKKKEKRLKKDRRKLKEILGIKNKTKTEGDVNG